MYFEPVAKYSQCASQSHLHHVKCHGHCCQSGKIRSCWLHMQYEILIERGKSVVKNDVICSEEVIPAGESAL